MGYANTWFKNITDMFILLEIYRLICAMFVSVPCLLHVYVYMWLRVISVRSEQWKV